MHKWNEAWASLAKETCTCKQRCHFGPTQVFSDATMSVDTYHLPTPAERPDKRNSAARPLCIIVHLDCSTQFLGFCGFLKNVTGDAQLASDPTIVSWLVETNSVAASQTL